MDHNFTEKIKQWLDTPAAERDYTVGALYMLKLSGNRVVYQNTIRNLNARKDFIEYQLQKYYNFRVQALTHARVEDMAEQVNTIAVERKLEAPAADGEPRATGKRADHDSLPAEIQALYQENLPILQRMRELHLQLRKLSLTDATCPDSERYPFLKELIALDKKMRANWEKYDNYTPPAAKKTKKK
ncbi:MAG: hypothetical protein NC301_07455 [Bacteroides sp.]|nr:hypothetical protein [Bacteroides sp.]MCM1379997.1 hypothetical protein [Bacteroides sp.]MCM1446323.1 hypothetical protein [Prevotella sp.]